MGYLCNEKKNQERKKSYWTSIEPLLQKELFNCPEIIPQIFIYCEHNNFSFKMYSIRPVKKIGYKLEKTCKQAVIFFIKHLNIILQAKIWNEIW